MDADRDGRADTDRPKHELTPATPFGGAADDAPWARRLFQQLIVDAPDADLEGYASDDVSETTVDPVPRARGVPLEAILGEQLDFLHHEAFYVVDTDFAVNAYRTLWFGLQFDAETVEEGETVGNGALRLVHWADGVPADDGYIQGAFHGMKTVVGDMIDRGVFTERAGVEYMTARLREWASAPGELRIRTPD